MVICIYIWLYMVIDGYTWLYMVIYGYLRHSSTMVQWFYIYGYTMVFSTQQELHGFIYPIHQLWL